jgi:hypothetical protein
MHQTREAWMYGIVRGSVHRCDTIVTVRICVAFDMYHTMEGYESVDGMETVQGSDASK